MSFVDEAVRLSREEKMRQAAERREARQLGLKVSVGTVTIEDDPVPKPVSEATMDDSYMESDARHGEFDLANYEIRAAESGGEEDGDDAERKEKKRRTEMQSRVREKSHKEKM